MWDSESTAHANEKNAIVPFDTTTRVQDSGIYVRKSKAIALRRLHSLRPCATTAPQC